MFDHHRPRSRSKRLPFPRFPRYCSLQRVKDSCSRVLAANLAMMSHTPILLVSSKRSLRSDNDGASNSIGNRALDSACMSESFLGSAKCVCSDCLVFSVRRRGREVRGASCDVMVLFCAEDDDEDEWPS